jgi:hypothetical protein
MMIALIFLNDWSQSASSEAIYAFDREKTVRSYLAWFDTELADSLVE